MRRSLVFLVSWWLIAACGDDGATHAWPDRLYLALAGGETSVQLAEEEPEPF